MDNNTGDNANPRSGTNLALDYGPADFNRTHVFKFSGVYELPFGKGGSGLTRNLIGGWQTSGLLTWGSGYPFSVYANDLSNTGADVTAYANVTCTHPYNVPNRSVASWYSPSCVAQPGPGSFGNIGRNALSGPNQLTLDVSAAKNFAVTERARLQFRADFNNVLNHPVWAFPVGSQSVVNPATLGVASQIGTARIIQLSLKAIF